jgi:hypothetical protein
MFSRPLIGYRKILVAIKTLKKLIPSPIHVQKFSEVATAVKNLSLNARKTYVSFIGREEYDADVLVRYAGSSWSSCVIPIPQGRTASEH